MPLVNCVHAVTMDCNLNVVDALLPWQMAKIDPPKAT